VPDPAFTAGGFFDPADLRSEVTILCTGSRGGRVPVSSAGRAFRFARTGVYKRHVRHWRAGGLASLSRP